MNWKKFLSRKFLVAVLGVTVGLATSLGVDATEWQQIAGYVVSAASIVTYILGEAKIDAASAGIDAIDNIEIKVEPVPKPPDEHGEETE